MTVGEVGERQVIARVRSKVPASPAFVVVGIGDDAAVLEPPRNRLEIVTTDAAVEGIHFDRRFMDASAIGHRVLAANLSDLAAMGAEPRTALLSLILPDALPLADLDALLDAFLALAARTGTHLVGGNVTRSPGPLVIDVTVSGTAKRRKVLTRAGGRPGDELFVSGSIGGAAAGLAWLQQAGPGEPADPAVADAVARFLRPEPRLRLGLLAGRTRAASAAMDLSDGLADAVRQLAEASGTGARLDAAALPVHPGVAAVTGEGEAALATALSGGEDYELLLAVPRRAGRRFAAAAKLARVTVTRIGALTPAAAGLTLATAAGDRPIPEGFEHFRAQVAAISAAGR
ncbi:MAG: thiamine-phosphate kinase [Vicinamibacteraceae bacterium]